MAFTLWAQICWLPSSETPQRGSDICLRVAPSSSPVTGSRDNHWKSLQREGGHVCMMPLLNRYLAFQNADGESGRTDWWVMSTTDPFTGTQRRLTWINTSVIWWQIESALHEMYNYPTIGPNRAFSISIITVESVHGPEGELLQIPGWFREGSEGEGVFYCPALTFSPGACPTGSSTPPPRWTQPANSDQSVDKNNTSPLFYHITLVEGRLMNDCDFNTDNMVLGLFGFNHF